MSDTGKCLIDTGIHGYNNMRPEGKRSVAVAAALELINTRLAASGSVDSIETELEGLSSYADKIQEALTVK